MSKWNNVRFGDIIKIQQSDFEPDSESVWLLNLDMVEQQTGRIIEYNYVSKNEVGNSTIKFDEQNVLYSKLRPNLNKVVCPNQEGIATSELLPLLPDQSAISREYLAVFLRSSFFVDWAVSKTAGAKMPRLSPKDLMNKVIPLPPIETQKQIAATLDKATQTIDICNAILEKLDLLVKARFVEMTQSDRSVIPTRMGDIASYINGYAFKPTDWTETGKPIIRIQNLNDLAAKFNFYSGELDEKYAVSDGDILVSWATHFEAYIWNRGDAWLNQHIFKAVFDKMTVNKIYFVYATEEALRQAFKNAHGFKPTMEHIKRSDFENAIVQLPSLETQNQFAAFVEQTDKSKIAVQQVLVKAETLKKALMQEYFG